MFSYDVTRMRQRDSHLATQLFALSDLLEFSTTDFVYNIV